MPSSLQFPLILSELPTTPLISVLMPSYNYDRYLGIAIQSVLEQSYSHIELIVCDDGSTDESPAILRHLAKQEERLVLIEQPNAGVAAALNTAYKASQGELICLLDADDVFTEDKVARIVQQCHENQQAGFILHGMHVVDERGSPLYDLPRSGQFEEGWLAETVIRRGGRWRSMPASALCFRRQVADLLFPLPVDTLRSMADAYLYMLAPLVTEVAYIHKPLAQYRLHGENMTGSMQFDASSAEQFMHGMEQVHKSIQAKVCPDIFAHMPLQLERHLTYQEQTYLKALFGSAARSELLMQYARLLRLINKDDLYGNARKWMGLVANGVAIGLPSAWRPAWISWVMEARWRKWLGK